jgi:hypothetical protein
MRLRVRNCYLPNIDRWQFPKRNGDRLWWAPSKWIGGKRKRKACYMQHKIPYPDLRELSFRMHILGAFISSGYTLFSLVHIRLILVCMDRKKGERVLGLDQIQLAVSEP